MTKLQKILTYHLIYIFCFCPVLVSAENFRVYKVKEKDTLTKISKEQLHDPRKWKEFLKFNKIDNPNLIKPGLELKIPDSLAKKTTDDIQVARIEKFVGKVMVQKPGQKDWFSVSAGTFLYAGDTVQTEEKSAAEIGYLGEPEIIINLREKSTLKVKKEKVKSAVLSFGEAIFFVFRKKPSDEHAFQASTPSAHAGVRGTVFGVSSDQVETSRYSCLSGVVDVSAQGKTVTLQKGYGTIVKKGEPPVEPFLLPGEIKVKTPEKQ